MPVPSRWHHLFKTCHSAAGFMITFLSKVQSFEFPWLVWCNTQCYRNEYWPNILSWEVIWKSVSKKQSQRCKQTDGLDEQKRRERWQRRRGCWWWFTQSLMGKKLPDSNLSRTYVCAGRRRTLKSKKGDSSSSSSLLSSFRVSNPEPDTLLSWPLAAHRTHSQVSFPFMPSMAWSPPKPHRPLQAQKTAHSVCLDGLCRPTMELGVCWGKCWKEIEVRE